MSFSNPSAAFPEKSPKHAPLRLRPKMERIPPSAEHGKGEHIGKPPLPLVRHSRVNPEKLFRKGPSVLLGTSKNSRKIASEKTAKTPQRQQPQQNPDRHTERLHHPRAHRIVLISSERAVFHMLYDGLRASQNQPLRLFWAKSFVDARRILSAAPAQLIFLDARLGSEMLSQVYREFLLSPSDELPSPRTVLIGTKGAYNSGCKFLAATFNEKAQNRLLDDYVEKGDLNSELLARIVRYNLPRKQNRRRTHEGTIRALRESELRLRLMMQQLPALVWSIDSDLHLNIFGGSSLKDIMGAECFQGRKASLYEVFPSSTGEVSLPVRMAHRALDGQSVTYLFRWRNRTFRVNMEPLKDQQSRIVGAMGITVEITEQAVSTTNTRYAS